MKLGLHQLSFVSFFLLSCLFYDLTGWLDIRFTQFFYFTSFRNFILYHAMPVIIWLRLSLRCDVFDVEAASGKAIFFCELDDSRFPSLRSSRCVGMWCTTNPNHCLTSLVSFSSPVNHSVLFPALSKDAWS